MTATVFDNPEKGVGVSEELGVCVCVSVCVCVYVCVYEREIECLCVLPYTLLLILGLKQIKQFSFLCRNKIFTHSLSKMQVCELLL